MHGRALARLHLDEVETDVAGLVTGRVGTELDRVTFCPAQADRSTICSTQSGYVSFSWIRSQVQTVVPFTCT